MVDVDGHWSRGAERSAWPKGVSTKQPAKQQPKRCALRNAHYESRVRADPPVEKGGQGGIGVALTHLLRS